MALFIIHNSLSNRKGQATFSFIFLVGGIVVAIGATLAFLALTLINSSFGFRAGERAAAVASAGAEDALIQLIRNKAFATGGYAVPVDAATATVIVTQNSPLSSQATIESSAIVSSYQRKIRVVARVNAVTGEVSVLSWKKVVF